MIPYSNVSKPDLDFLTHEEDLESYDKSSNDDLPTNNEEKKRKGDFFYLFSFIFYYYKGGLFVWLSQKCMQQFIEQTAGLIFKFGQTTYYLPQSVLNELI